MDQMQNKIEIQTLIFMKEKYDRASAENWARESGFKYDRITEDEMALYFEQRIAQDFAEDTLRDLSVLEGIKQRVGELKHLAPEIPREVRTISNVEIFSEGVWNGNVITMGDLDEIVRSFEVNKRTIRPHLKLGHDDNQALLQSDGLPAAGWIDNLRRVGNKLVADFVDVPKKIAELIDLKAYRKVSSEIYHNIEINGATFGKMLGAVALLGSDLPGVMNLDDILSMYGYKCQTFNNDKSESVIINFSEENMSKTALEEKLEQEVQKYKSEISGLQEKVDAYSAKDEEIAEINQKLKDQAEAIEEYKRKEAESVEKAIIAEREKYAADLEKKELATPAMKDHIMALIGPEKDEYSVADKKVKSKEALLEEALKLFKASLDVNFEESSDSGMAVDESRELEIDKYMAEHKCSYSVAFRAVESKYRKFKED